MRVYVTPFIVIFTSISNKSSSFCLIINQNFIDYNKKRNILFIILVIDQFDLILVVHPKITSSSSTFTFDISSIQINDSEEKLHLTKSIICLNEKNFNQNANDIEKNLNQKKKFIHRLIQSSTDIITNDFYSYKNQENSHQNNGAIRIESALMTSDYSHLLNHSMIHASQPIIDINMNNTIDLIKRNEAGDENLSSHFNDKQVQTSIMTDKNYYLTIEQVPIRNRPMIQFTSKQLILISISVFVFVTLLCCLITSFFIF
jgi:hypothetical protein